MRTNQNLIRSLFFTLAMLFSSAGYSQHIFAEKHKTFVGINRIEIAGLFCDVEIIGTENDAVKLDGIIQGETKRGKKFEINYEVEDNLLRVWISSPHSFNGRIQAGLKLSVPKDIKLMIENGSGDIYCQGLISKNIDLLARSGDIEMKSIQGEVHVITSSGDISMQNFQGDAVLQSSSGDQKFSDIVGNITTKSHSGNLEVERVQGDIYSQTTSGNLSINKQNGSISNVSTSGDIEIFNSQLYLNLTTSSGDIQAKGVELLGETYLQTSSGSINFGLSNDPSQLSFDLEATSGIIKVGNKSAEDELYLQGGNIWIHGKSSSGDQVYR